MSTKYCYCFLLLWLLHVIKNVHDENWRETKPNRRYLASLTTMNISFSVTTTLACPITTCKHHAKSVSLVLYWDKSKYKCTKHIDETPTTLTCNLMDFDVYECNDYEKPKENRYAVQIINTADNAISIDKILLMVNGQNKFFYDTFCVNVTFEYGQVIDNNCVALSGDIKRYDSMFINSKYYPNMIVRMEEAFEALALPSTDRKCIKDSNKYILVGQQKTWQDAQSFCQSEYGSNLGTFLSEQDLIIAMDMLKTPLFIYQDAWFGLYKDDDDMWVWVDETPNINFIWWAPGEPNDKHLTSTEGCAGFHHVNEYLANDFYCGNEQIFFCNNNLFTTTTDVKSPSPSPSISPSNNPSINPSSAPTKSPSKDQTINWAFYVMITLLIIIVTVVIRWLIMRHKRNAGSTAECELTVTECTEYNTKCDTSIDQTITSYLNSHIDSAEIDIHYSPCEWIELTRPPQLFTTFYPNPLYFHSMNAAQRYIVFSPGGNASCVLYDICKDEYETITCDDSSVIEFKSHGHCINEQKKLLYVFSETYCCRFNITHKKWKQPVHIGNVMENQDMKFEFPSICCIGSEINDIFHIFMNGSYYSWNDELNSWNFITKVCGDAEHCIPFYANGKIYAVVSDQSGQENAYFCRDTLNNSTYWKYSKLRLPGIMDLRSDAKVVVVFNCIIILFHYHTNNIWYLDLKSSDIESENWKLSTMECENKTSQFLVSVNNTFIHSINEMWHRKIPISSIIGKDLCAKYDGRLVNGWIRQNVRAYVSVDIVTLMCIYFS